MRIAIVNSTAQRAGGIETYLDALIPALGAHRHNVHYLHERVAEGLPAMSSLDGVPTTCVDEAGVKGALADLAAWAPEVLFVQAMESPVLERRLLGLAPAVFFAHDYSGTCISGSKTFRYPVIQPCDRRFGPMCLLQFYPRRCGGLNPLTMATRYRRAAVRLAALRRYRRIVTFSEHMRSEYRRHGFSDDSVRKLPPVDTLDTDDTPGTETPRAGTARPPRQGFHLVYVGRIDLLKGCRVLLEALPLVRERLDGSLRLTVAGIGTDFDRCQAVAANVGGRLAATTIEFVGWASRERCQALLRDADVLVMPSLWPEPFGLAGLEAVHHGVPVAAFAVGGIREWLEHGKTGVLAPADPPSAAGLAQAIVECLTSSAIRQSVAEHARGGHNRHAIGEHVDALVPVLAAAAVGCHQDDARR